MKYNYKKAAEIWDHFYLLICNPWEFDETEKQQNRRHFMRVLTRKIGFGPILDTIAENIENEYISKEKADRLTDEILSFVIVCDKDKGGDKK